MSFPIIWVVAAGVAGLFLCSKGSNKKSDRLVPFSPKSPGITDPMTRPEPIRREAPERERVPIMVAPHVQYMPMGENVNLWRYTPDDPREQSGTNIGEAAAEAALFYLDQTPTGFNKDCSGFISACYERAGILLDGNVRDWWERAEAAGAIHHIARPQIGDIAFFDFTYDKDSNGRLDDVLTHVAIVTALEDDDTVVMAHDGTSDDGPGVLRMNLHRPDVYKDEDGRVLNDYLRRPKDGVDRTDDLSGKLWHGFATVSPGSTVTVEALDLSQERTEGSTEEGAEDELVQSFSTDETVDDMIRQAEQDALDWQGEEEE